MRTPSSAWMRMKTKPTTSILIALVQFPKLFYNSHTAKSLQGSYFLPYYVKHYLNYINYTAAYISNQSHFVFTNKIHPPQTNYQGNPYFSSCWSYDRITIQTSRALAINGTNMS